MSYDVGTHKNIVLLSVPEGDDKIEKYPVMFRRADVVLSLSAIYCPILISSWTKPGTA